MPDGRAITSQELAALIVDALADAGLVPRERLNEAIQIGATEIDVRKALGDYADDSTGPQSDVQNRDRAG